MTQEYDLVVVGAGITGAGIAQAAAAAGRSVLVLERTAIAAGTSSRSSKLIHGGLRYLESGQFRLVRESLREREILLRIAPDLVHRVAFFIPVYAHTRRPPWMVRAGLSLYALLGGLAAHARFRSVMRGTWDELDGLTTAGLRAVFRYSDAQTDDAALTRAVMASAQTLGATLACPAHLVAAHRERDGVRIDYSDAGRETSCRARVLINAAGPWINDVLNRISPPLPRVDMELMQGAHIVVPGTMEQGIYYVEAPRDGRAVFVMPWRGQTLVGTTETPVTGATEPEPQPAEIDYLLETLERYFPGRATAPVAAFAGVRVLPRGPGTASGRSRATLLHVDDRHRPRVLTVAGGKLTGYRAVAQRVLALLAPALPPPARAIDTATLILPSADACR